MSGILDLSDPGSQDAGGDVASAVLNVLNANLLTGTPTPGSFIAINVADADTLTFQLDGTWVGTLAAYGSLNGTTRVPVSNAINVNGGGAVSAFNSTAANGIYQLDVAGLSYIYLFMTAYTSGSVSVTVSPTDNTGVVGLDGGSAISISNVTPGTGAASLGKAEDAAAANGDTLTPGAGVRIPATPAAQTSANGDYGAFAIDQEGKQIIAMHAADENSWQGAPVTITTTTSTAVKAAAAAGIRNFITDVDIANTSATAVRVDLLDGATVLKSFQVAAGQHLMRSFTNALRGTAATAVNFQASAAVTDLRCSANGYLGV